MFEEGVIASYLVLWHFWLKKNVIKTSVEPKYPCSSLIVQKYCPEMFPVIKVIKIHQNHQIQQADFTFGETRSERPLWLTETGKRREPNAVLRF